MLPSTSYGVTFISVIDRVVWDCFYIYCMSSVSNFLSVCFALCNRLFTVLFLVLVLFDISLHDIPSNFSSISSLLFCGSLFIASCNPCILSLFERISCGVGW